MEKKKILPVSDQPLITSNGMLSYFCSFASLHPCFDKWLATNFLLLTFVNGVRIQDREEFQLNFFAPSVEYCELYDTVKADNKDVSPELIREKISQGGYCIVEVNVRYVPNSACFRHQTDGTHGILVHGYDDGSGEIYVISFGANGRPERVAVRYDDLIKALKTSYPVNPCMFFKPKDITYGFRWDKILSSFIFHLGKHEAVLDEEKGIKVSTGYAAEERLAECLSLNEDRGIDIRLFAMLKDHKKVLIQAVKSFSEFGIVFDDAVTSGLESILKNADVAEKLCIKYNMLRDGSIKKRIAERILMIISEEKKIYPMMIDSIGCYVFEYVVQ